MEVWELAVVNFYSKRNIHPDDEEPELLRNMTLEESIPYIIKKHHLSETPQAIVNELKESVMLEYKNSVLPKDGAVDYIKRLHSKGVKIGIATSGYIEFCKAAFARLGIDKYISAYALSSEVGVNKSNPEVYLLAASRLDLPPEKCIVFEDIIAGIRGAKKGGFITCAVMDSTNLSITDKLTSEADIYIKSFDEI